jgi:hypothetical protein
MELPEGEDDIPDTSLPDAFEALIGAGKIASFNRAFRKLAPREKQAIIITFVRKHKMEERRALFERYGIQNQLLGLSEKGLEKLWYRTRNNLRKIIRSDGAPLSDYRLPFWFDEYARIRERERRFLYSNVDAAIFDAIEAEQRGRPGQFVETPRFTCLGETSSQVSRLRRPLPDIRKRVAYDYLDPRSPSPEPSRRVLLGCSWCNSAKIAHLYNVGNVRFLEQISCPADLNPGDEDAFSDIRSILTYLCANCCRPDYYRCQVPDCRRRRKRGYLRCSEHLRAVGDPQTYAIGPGSLLDLTEEVLWL